MGGEAALGSSAQSACYYETVRFEPLAGSRRGVLSEGALYGRCCVRGANVPSVDRESMLVAAPARGTCERPSDARTGHGSRRRGTATLGVAV